MGSLKSLYRPQTWDGGIIAARAAFAAALTLALFLPLGASSAQSVSDERNVPFAALFADVIEPIAPDIQEIDPLAPPTAVDLDTFDPPIEVEPAAGAVIRDLGNGVASYYGRRFHGRLTANGERFDMRAMTAAHKTLPFGTMVRVTNRRNGRSVTVRINDRGPFIRGRTIDLSRGAAEQIGLIAHGHAPVGLELVSR